MSNFPRQSILRAGALLLAAVCLVAPSTPALASARADDLAEAKALAAQAAQLSQQGRYAEAVPLVERALAIREKAAGPLDVDTVLLTIDLAELYRNQGQYAKAEPLFTRLLTLSEKATGEDRAFTAFALNGLARLYVDQGLYTKAEPLYVRAIDLYEQTLGPKNATTAIAVDNLAELYRTEGEYAKAEPLYRRAIAVNEAALGREHPFTARSVNNLGLLYFDQAQYAEAEPLFMRALAIYEKALGADHPNTLLTVNNLAQLYQNQGQYARAEPLLVRALAANEKALGPDSPTTARSLNNLGLLYLTQGQYAKAEPLLTRSLSVYEKVSGPDHPSTALPINNLAFLYFAQGQYAKAEPLYVRALAINEKAFGPENPSTARLLDNLALLYSNQGQYAKAEPLALRALAIREKTLRPGHPYTAASLSNLSLLYTARGDYARAVETQARAVEARERDLQLNLVSGSEREKLVYLWLSSGEVYQTLSLHAQHAPSDPAARRLALETLLRRKGRGLDAMLESVDALRRRAARGDVALLDELASARAELSRRTLDGPGAEDADRYRADLTALEAKVEQLEERVSARSAEFRVAAQPVTLDSVRRQIPEGALLVEYAAYFPFDAKTRTWGEQRYSAYTLGRDGEPGWVDLGPAARIDAAVAVLRDVLRAKGSPEWVVRVRARALDALVMQPVRAIAGDTRWLLLAPDSALNLVPFAALVDERDQYLVERYTLSYLTSGRDLLRLAVARPAASAPVLVADPDFDTGPAPTASTRSERGERSELSTARFTPLPGTAEEAAAVAPLLKGVRVLTHAAASEQRIKQVRAPRILHVATHGFFLDGVRAAPPADAAASRLLVHDASAPLAAGPVAGAEYIPHPLLRSGLGLAGANARNGGKGEDGILTALEVAGLNLWGTKLVVLSACDTGVGEATTGEGVFGLRRALVLAGSETQMMSLWPVSDAGTRDLMIAYYRGLTSGRSRSDALREVQLAMLRDPARRHPYYWASFIESGAWGPLGAR